MAFIKGAEAFRIHNQVLLQGISMPIGGPTSRLYGPVFTVDASNLTMVGYSIMDALNESIENCPPKKGSTLDPNAPLLKAAKVRSWTALNKVSQSVDITQKENCITFTPTRRVSRLAHTFLNSKSLTCDLDPENMGRTLLQAFELCEPLLPS